MDRSLFGGAPLPLFLHPRSLVALANWTDCLQSLAVAVGRQCLLCSTRAAFGVPAGEALPGVDDSDSDDGAMDDSSSAVSLPAAVRNALRVSKEVAIDAAEMFDDSRDVIDWDMVASQVGGL